MFFQCRGNKPFKLRYSLNSSLFFFFLVCLNHLLQKREKVKIFVILFIQYFIIFLKKKTLFLCHFLHVIYTYANIYMLTADQNQRPMTCYIP